MTWFFLFSCLFAEPIQFPAGKILDLSHDFADDTVYWPTANGFRLTEVFKGETDKGFHYEANEFSAAEHGGTHLDAPNHFAKDRLSSDQLPLEKLMGPCALLDVSAQCAQNRDYQVQISDIEAWEKKHGKLPKGAILLLRTGFAAFWPDRGRYMGTAERGPDAVSKLHFPGLHPDAAAWLVQNRDIHAVGLDTPSIDYGQSSQFESHRRLFEKNVPALENVASMAQIPETGAFIIAMPMKIRGGSGGPCRILAIVP